MLERDFQANLRKDILRIFPGSMVIKLPTDYQQGLPDLLILYKNKWAVLECKRYSNSHHQNNQDYYIQKMDKMSFGRFIDSDNKEEVLNELRQKFKV